MSEIKDGTLEEGEERYILFMDDDTDFVEDVVQKRVFPIIEEVDIPELNIAVAANVETFENFDMFCMATNRPFRRAPWGRGKMPAVNITFEDMLLYCNWLSEHYGLEPVYNITYKDGIPVDFTVDNTKSGWRLPTIQERDHYATDPEHKFPGSDDELEVGWVYANSNNQTQPVGQKKPYRGMYDLWGNVREPALAIVEDEK